MHEPNRLVRAASAARNIEYDSYISQLHRAPYEPKKDDITESSKVLGNVVGPLADRDALLETLLKELLAVNVGLARAPRVQVVHLHVEHQGVEVELFHDSAGV